MTARVDYTIRSQTRTPSGLVQTTAALRDGRLVTIVTPFGDAIYERLDPLIQNAIASGRFDRPPTSPPEVSA